MREWLVKLRKNLNMTQDYVAKRCNISRVFYTLIETGSRRPSVEVAKQIATLLNFEWTKFFED